MLRAWGPRGALRSFAALATTTVAIGLVPVGAAQAADPVYGVATALFWFNPLVWLLAREAHQLREEAADDSVLAADIPDTDYAQLLVGVVFGSIQTGTTVLATDAGQSGIAGLVHACLGVGSVIAGLAVAALPGLVSIACDSRNCDCPNFSASCACASLNAMMSAIDCIGALSGRRSREALRSRLNS